MLPQEVWQNLSRHTSAESDKEPVKEVREAEEMPEDGQTTEKEAEKKAEGEDEDNQPKSLTHILWNKTF